MIAKKIGLPEEKVGKNNNLANRLFFPCLVTYPAACASSQTKTPNPHAFFFFITNVLFFYHSILRQKNNVFYQFKE